MKYDRELINTRIEHIKDPIQKVLLQDVLKDVFRIIMDYSEERFCQLEEKIDKELDVVLKVQESSICNIWTGICETSKLDETSSFLFPVETEEQERNTNVLERIFLSCNYDKVKSCLGREFPAIIETEDNTYPIPIMLTYSKGYLKKIEWLYKQFYQNKREWKTINCPFLYKFLDVVDIKNIVPKEEKIKKVVLDLGELNSYVYTNMLLVWNIQEINADTSPCVVPGEKAVLFEHKVEVEQESSSYLVEMNEKESFYIIYQEDGLIIRTRTKGYDNLKVLRIAKIDLEKDNTKLFLPLQSNKRNMRHVDKQAWKQPKVIFTYGEMVRILSSYEAYQGFELEEVYVRENVKEKKGKEDRKFVKVEEINYNYFIPENGFIKKKRELVFAFLVEDKNDVLLYEKIAFLLSEIQLLLEEYQCVGEIISK